MSEWYIAVDGEPHGPYSRDQIKKLLAEGKVARDAVVRQKGGQEWVPILAEFGSKPRDFTQDPNVEARAFRPGPPQPSPGRSAGGSKWLTLNALWHAAVLGAALLIAALVLVLLVRESGWAREEAERDKALKVVLSTLPKWEYKVRFIFADGGKRTGDDALQPASATPSEEELNQMGKDGWELVTTYLESETAFPNFGKEQYVTGIQPNVRPQRLVLVFRRPLVVTAPVPPTGPVGS